MVQPAYQHSSNNENMFPCYLENAFELLGDATHGKSGDYYFDTNSDSIYYVGPFPPKHAVLPQSEGLLIATNVSDFDVSGIALQESTW